MKGEVISSNHTMMLEDFQIDLWYNFSKTWLQIFVDGELIIEGNYTPHHKQFNYVNLMEVAATALQQYKNKKLRQEQQSQII